VLPSSSQTYRSRAAGTYRHPRPSTGRGKGAASTRPTAKCELPALCRMLALGAAQPLDDGFVAPRQLAKGASAGTTCISCPHEAVGRDMVRLRRTRMWGT
jgi:hypothetical protein